MGAARSLGTGKPTGEASRFAGRAWLAGALGFAVLTAGCTLYEKVIVPRQQWSEQWGPLVPHETFPGDCSLCHFPDRWDLIKPGFEFDHAAETSHELHGAHADAACLRCHNDRGPVEAYVARGCGGCHTDPHRSTLGLDCQRCHQETTWQPLGMIAEHAGSRFPLMGAHAFAACAACHERASVGEYRGAPVDCHLCHQQEAARAQPNHAINGWNRDCQDCHDVVDWRSVAFDHSIFPLQGGHAGVDCSSCHVGGRVVGTPNDCFSCHRQDYLSAPDHVTNGLSTDCAQCHDIFGWDR